MTEMLDGIFDGVENFQQEFPAICKDMERGSIQNKAMRQSQTADPWQNVGGREYKQIHMTYNPGKKKLRVRGRIHKSDTVAYGMAEMTVRNNRGNIMTHRYTVISLSFFVFDEELTVEEEELNGICAEIRYMYRLRRGLLPVLAGKAVTTRIEGTGIDIIGDGKVIHPVSRYRRDKINIIYWRKDNNNTADYCYAAKDYVLKDSQQRFLIHLPIAVQFNLDQGFALSQTPDIEGSALISSRNHGFIEFHNWAQVKLIPASQWKAEGNKYPEISGKSNYSYLLVFPQAWNNPIEKDGIFGEDDFFISLDIQFTCTDGKRYSLEMASCEKPAPYSGGARVEIPCIYLIWGCIEKNAEVEVYGKGRIPVREVQTGDKILSEDDTYETVCDVITGDEEILKFIRVNGRELQVTMDHPVMTQEGWKPAGKLVEGEKILFQDGKFYPLQEIYSEPYYDSVYSLRLEHGGGFFANQIYVGDFQMQNSIKKKEPEIPQEILAELEKFRNK